MTTLAPAQPQPQPEVSAGLFVHEEGRGDPAMLLLHGLGGSWRYWGNMLPTIARHRRAVCPDLLGFGRSPWPDVHYTMDQHIDALTASVFPRLSEPFDLVGHSLGSLIALELAARHPHRVRSLTLLAFPCYDSDSEAESFVRQEFWGRLMLDHPRAAKLACTVVCKHRRGWRHVLPAMMASLPADVVEDGMMHSYHSISSTLLETIIPYRVSAAAQQWEEAGRRVRLVAAEDDRAAPPSLARRFADRWSNADVVVVDHATHNFPLTHFTWNERLLSCGCGPECPMFSSPAVEPA